MREIPLEKFWRKVSITSANPETVKKIASLIELEGGQLDDEMSVGQDYIVPNRVDLLELRDKISSIELMKGWDIPDYVGDDVVWDDDRERKRYEAEGYKYQDGYNSIIICY